MVLVALALATTPVERVVVGPLGPELHAETVSGPSVMPKLAEPVPAEPSCLTSSRIFHYTASALDVATTIAALEGNRNLEEANPIVGALFGKQPSPFEIIASKVVIVFGIRRFEEYLVHKDAGKHACIVNFGFGTANLLAAGLNARFVF